MDAVLDTVIINGVEYAKRDAQKALELSDNYVIVRTYSAGVFAGVLKERNGKEGVMLHSRRLWYWDGAASLSQLSVDGVSKPENCKFPCEIQGEHILTEIIEVIPCTKKAQESIKSVPVWEK